MNEEQLLSIRTTVVPVQPQPTASSATGDYVSIAATAAASRAGAVALAVVADAFLPDHAAQGALLPPIGPGCTLAYGALQPFTRWDAAHFLLVAQSGWQAHEWSHAFFPLFPLLAFHAGRLLRLLSPWPLCETDSILLAGVFLSNVAFPLAALALLALGRAVLGCPRLAYRAAFLFCASPATPFFSSLYSESLFALFTFTGFFLLETRRPAPWAAALCLAAASATRSNGILSLPIVAYHGALRLQELCSDKSARPIPPKLSNRVSGTRAAASETNLAGAPEAAPVAAGGAGCLPGAFGCRASLGLARIAAELAVQCAIVLAPYAAWQLAGYRRFCTSPEGAVNRHSPPDWCGASMAPDLYRHVQATHWGLGAFRFWMLKQWPNFALAAPALSICAAAVAASVAQLRRRTRTGRPPLRYSQGGRPCCEPSRRQRRDSTEDGLSSGGERLRRAKGSLSTPASPVLAYLLRRGPGAAAPPRPGALCARADVYVGHWTMLSAFCLVCAHVQVTTRLVCAACPPFYWYLARLTAGKGEGAVAGAHIARDHADGAMRDTRLHSPQGARFTRGQRVLWCYFGLYAVGGTALHANFFPWT